MIALGVVLIASSLALFDKAGVHVPIGVIVAIPASFAAGVIAQQIVRRTRAVRTASSSAGSSPSY